MKQSSFSDLAYEHKKKTTRKERFLGEMEAILPWDELLKPIEERYPTAGQGRRPVPAEVMLRIYFLQQWYGLSDPGMEDSLRCGIDAAFCGGGVGGDTGREYDFEVSSLSGTASVNGSCFD